MPIALAAIPAAIGLYQTLFSGRKKAERQLESAAANAPTYAGNKGVSDYYNEAFNRYMTSPTNSALYQNSMANINRNSSNILNGLQDRRGALDAVGQIDASNNQASTNAVIAAENQRNQRFGLLGNATQMKNADDMQKFQINTLMPYQSKLSLLATKASNKNQQFNQGLSNVANATSSALASYGAYKDGGGNGSFWQWGTGGGGNTPYITSGSGYNPNVGGTGGSWNPSFGYTGNPN